ncbi:MAG: DJ-1 family protein [Flavobacteriia bacterium]|nr:MAG: DJ-1 family protein [Flavobacteriia bacterium]
MEAVIPYDLLLRAGIDVVVASLNGEKSVTGAHGLTVESTVALENAGEDFDLILLPGGLPGSEYLAKSDAVCQRVQQQLKAGKYVAAICAAPAFVLAKACDVVKGKNVTGYPGTEEMLSESGGNVVDCNAVQDGNLITGKGPGAAADFALKIISVLKDQETADEVASQALFSVEGH